MKQYLVTLCGILCITAAHGQNTISISAGTTVVSSGTVTVNANNFVNNGTYTDNAGTFLALGGVVFTGSGTTNLFNFKVNNTGVTALNSLVSVQNTATLTSGTLTAGSNNLFIRSDLHPSSANIVVAGALTGAVKGLITKATVITGGCPSYTSDLSLNISGPAVLYQWESSPDSATWTPTPGGNTAAYTATVTNTVYYHCNITTNNSAFVETTPGIKLVFTGVYPAAIAGEANICLGFSTTLTESAIDGAWSSSNSNVATVNGSGLVTSVSQGATTISYSNSCGTMTKDISVNAAPAAIAGSSTICFGGGTTTTMLSDASTNGVWSSNNAGVATVNSIGLVTSASQGTATISYGNGCGSVVNKVMTVNATPALIGGNAPLCANGSALTLTNTSTNGTWSSSNPIIASVNPATGLVTSESGSTAGGIVTIKYDNGCMPVAQVTLTVNALPVIHTFTGGGGYCSGDSGVHIGLTLTQAGISYQLYRTPDVAIGSPAAGTGSAIGFGTWHTAPGVYYAIATNTATGCTSYLPGVTVHINPLPDTFTVTGGGSYCAGGTGMPVGLSGSAPGITYQLYNSGLPLGAALTGTGSSLGFGAQTLAGSYTVIGTIAATQCSSAMGVTAASINILPLPGIFTVTGRSNFCLHDSGVHIGLSSSATGIAYQLYHDGTLSGPGITGSGTVIDFGLHDTTGIYTVSATDPITHCSVIMDNADTLTVNPLPAVHQVTGGGTYCAGGTGLHIGTDNSDAGIRYWLYISTSGTGTPLNGTGTTLDFGLFLAAGTYSVIAVDTTTGCMSAQHDSAVINIAPVVIPEVSLATGLSTGNTVCLGNPVTFTAQTHYGGASPAYAWTVNNISVTATDSTFTYVPVNGDAVTVKLHSSGQCAIPDTAQNSVTINVDTPAVPSVFIDVSPLTQVPPGTMVTLTAIPTNGGLSPAYQWYRNESIIAGATNSVYSSQFADHDSISVIMINSGGCGGVVTFNSVIIALYPSGISPVNATVSDIRLVPNPNKGIFTVTGTLGTINNEEASLEVTDMLGQVIYRNKVMSVNGNINERIQLGDIANGMYLFNLLSATEHKVFHIVVEK